MKLLVAEFLLAIVAFVQIATASLEEDYKREGIIPDVLDKAPVQLLQVLYNGKEIEFGKKITSTSEVKDAPTIGWNFDASSYYTLVLVDPDAPSRQDPKWSEYRHWMMANIPGNDFTKGEILAGYIGAGPPPDTGLHRYIFTVYKQMGKSDFGLNPINDMTLDGRANFSLRKFAEKYQLGDPIAGNMFQAQFDDYVPIFYKKFGM